MDDILINISLNSDDLDDVINIALTSKQVNERLNTPYYTKLLAHHLGIDRPVIDWEDLIRENSKIRATKYAKVKDDVVDYPNMRTIVRNALKYNKYVNKYLEYIELNDIVYSTDVDTIKMLFGLLYEKGTDTVTTIKPECLDSDGKFSMSILYTYMDEIIPKYGKYFTGSKLIIDLENAINQILIQDIPIDSIFTNITNMNYYISVSTNAGNKYSLKMNNWMIGPNNWEYINNYEIFYNPCTKLVFQNAIKIPPMPFINYSNLQSACQAVTVSDRKPGIEVVKYLVEVVRTEVTNDLVNLALYSYNIQIAQYLIIQLGNSYVFDKDMYTNQKPRFVHIKVEDINLLYQILGDQLHYVLRMFKFINPDDDIIVFEMLVGKVPDDYFETLLTYQIEQDNIRSVAFISKQINKTVNGLTTDQERRLSYYI